MGASPSPRTHSSSGAVSAAGEGRKGCLFLKMPFAIQVPSMWFYSAESYTRHQTSPRLLCAGSFPRGESCLDLPRVFQSISPVRHTDKLKQAHFNRAQKEGCEGSARRGRAASPCSLSFPVEIRKAAAFPAPSMWVFSPRSTHKPNANKLFPGKEEEICHTGGGWGSDGIYTTGLQARVGTCC